MQRNVAGQKLLLFAFDVTTGLPKTGDAANITAYRSLDGGTLTALADTAAAEVSAANAAGWYSFDLAQGETDGAEILFSGKSTTANVSVVSRLVPTDDWDTPNGVETGWTKRQALRQMLRVMCAKRRHMNTTSPKIRDMADSKDAVTVTGADNYGNWTSVSHDKD